MKHISFVTQERVQPASTALQIKLQAITDIIDRLLLAQRQAPWKAAPDL